jgi:hypothetical protein
MVNKPSNFQIILFIVQINCGANYLFAGYSKVTDPENYVHLSDINYARRKYKISTGHLILLRANAVDVCVKLYLHSLYRNIFTLPYGIPELRCG